MGFVISVLAVILTWWFTVEEVEIYVDEIDKAIKVCENVRGQLISFDMNTVKCTVNKSKVRISYEQSK